MCGILGVINRSNDINMLESFEDALILMRHRGPNDIGIESIDSNSKRVVFGQTRLSIIDLTSGGHQPIYGGENDRYCMVFNGEIYNYLEIREELRLLKHQFKTNSDTEVLLHAWIQWGESCLNRLKGMFAFAVYDKDDQVLTCVRDAFGIKPFFYTEENGEFIFSSELSALKKLLPDDPDLNLQRAYDYLVHGHYDEAAETFYKGVLHLKPASILRYDLNKKSSTIQRWWWPSVSENKNISLDEAAIKFRDIFLNNIKLHLRSDVPVGVALSGGLDSSAVACAVRHILPNHPIHTFTYVAQDSVINEEHWADLIAKHISAISHKIKVKSSEFSDDLDKMIHCQGEPFGSTSIYASYRVFEKVKSEGVVVTLDGQGADEMLAGYRGYPGERMLSLLQNGQFLDALKFLLHWSKWPNRSAVHGIFALIQALLPPNWQTIPRKIAGKNVVPGWINTAVIKSRNVIALKSLVAQFSFQREPGRALVSTLRHTMLNGSLVNLLRHGDRNSMRWSIESRVPFLTIELVEFLLSLPESYLISNKGETKHIMRLGLRGLVPDAVLDRKDKIGFETPEKDWLMHLHLSEKDFALFETKVPYIKKEFVKDEIQNILNNNKVFSYQAWRLINMMLWIRQNESEINTK